MEEKNVDDIRKQIDDLQSKLKDIDAFEKIKKEEAEPIRTLISWEAPDRVYVERTRNWYIIVSFFFMIGIAFAALTKEMLLIVALIGLLFLVYLSSTIKPGLVKHEITNKGIRSGRNLWVWKDMKGFWISRRGKQNILLVDLQKEASPNRIMLLVGTANAKELVGIMIRHAKYMPQQEVGEDIINIFTLGSYRPITDFMKDIETK